MGGGGGSVSQNIWKYKNFFNIRELLSSFSWNIGIFFLGGFFYFTNEKVPFSQNVKNFFWGEFFYFLSLGWKMHQVALLYTTLGMVMQAGSPPCNQKFSWKWNLPFFKAAPPNRLPFYLGSLYHIINSLFCNFCLF